jgi:hypothetical protein
MKSSTLFKTILPLFLLLIISCESDPIEPLTEPTINETTFDNLTYTSIDISGSIISNNILINSRGICWDTNPNPTIFNNKTSESDDTFTSSITDLIANTTYYYKTYVSSSLGTIYGEERTFSTLSLDSSDWTLHTFYDPASPFVSQELTIHANLNLYEDGTTKYDEIGQGAGAFITYGSWNLDGNNFTYIWEGTDPDLNNATYIYTGIISGMEMSGTYIHPVLIESTWSAEIQ